MLVYALDAARLPAQRGAEIAPPSNNIVVDTLSLDAPHHHSLIERVTGAFTLSEPQDRCRVVEHQVVRHALPDSVEDAPEVVLQTKCADVLVVDFLSANAQRLERLVIRWNYARASYLDDDIRMSELRESVETLEDTERTAQRVLGSAHLYVQTMGQSLQEARAALRARDSADMYRIFGTDSSGDSS